MKESQKQLRIEMLYNGLKALAENGESLSRTNLFVPSELPNGENHFVIQNELENTTWQRESIHRMIETGLITKLGDRRSTTYLGDKNKIIELLIDHDNDGVELTNILFPQEPNTQTNPSFLSVAYSASQAKPEPLIKENDQIDDLMTKFAENLIYIREQVDNMKQFQEKNMTSTIEKLITVNLDNNESFPKFIKDLAKVDEKGFEDLATGMDGVIKEFNGVKKRISELEDETKTQRRLIETSHKVIKDLGSSLSVVTDVASKLSEIPSLVNSVNQLVSLVKNREESQLTDILRRQGQILEDSKTVNQMILEQLVGK